MHPLNSSDLHRTAAALVIGNELLTGKTQDTNVPVLARELFELGVSLRRVVMCPDEIETIVGDLDNLRRSYDFVVTSGGVGPTHDDVTMTAVARAFGQRLVRAPQIAALLREFYGDRLTPHHLLMADVPEGADLITISGSPWPTVRIENVFVLPGLPGVFRKKMAVLREVLGSDCPFVSRAVGTRSDEGDLAELLEQLSHEHPEVAIGSYPRWGDDPVQVLVTFDGRADELVDHAVAALLAALPPDQIVDRRGRLESVFRGQRS